MLMGKKYWYKPQVPKLSVIVIQWHNLGWSLSPSGCNIGFQFAVMSGMVISLTMASGVKGRGKGRLADFLLWYKIK